MDLSNTLLESMGTCSPGSVGRTRSPAGTVISLSSYPSFPASYSSSSLTSPSAPTHSFSYPPRTCIILLIPSVDQQVKSGEMKCGMSELWIHQYVPNRYERRARSNSETQIIISSLFRISLGTTSKK